MPSPWSRPADAVVAELESDLAHGLASEGAAARRSAQGDNTLPAGGGPPWWRVLFRQLADVLVVILVLAAVISALAGAVEDALVITAIVVLNALLGFAQEWRAERALQALQRVLSPRCRVLRDGEERSLDAAELVVGDVVVVAPGDRVPADLRLVEVHALAVDESALTGESVPAAKAIAPVPPKTALAARRCMAWSGTAVIAGRGRGVVVATGRRTELGRIAALTGGVDRRRTPLQRKLAVLGRQLGGLAIGAAALVGVAGVVGGRPWLEMFMTAVALAVAVVPEGLPAVVTITLALGTRAMLRRRALLRRLQAAETLGSATVICSDKTGTLTENQMTVQRIWLPGGALTVEGVGTTPLGGFRDGDAVVPPATRPDLQHLLAAAAVCSDARLVQRDGAWEILGAPTEGALLVAARKAGITAKALPERVAEQGFSAERKRMSVVVADGGAWRLVCKGAPEVLLSRCVALHRGGGEEPLLEPDRARIRAVLDELTTAGLRTLAVCDRALPDRPAGALEGLEERLVLLGIVGVIDPPRAEVAEAVAVARRAGVHTLMITGDAPGTALAVARSVGLDAGRALAGPQLDALDDDALDAALAEGCVFARTTPEHKLRIVRRLQARGEVVAMTGDGVNDAPALQQADIGVAMGLRGTEVARGAADMVLTDDNYASIVGAIEEGRRQYANIQKFVRYLLASNTGEVLAIAVNIALGGPLLLLPVQILWMNLVTDGLTAVALGLEPAEAQTMAQPPRPRDERLLPWRAAAMVLALGGFIAVVALAAFHWGGADAEVDRARTLAFTAIVITEKLNVFNFRSLRTPLVALGPLGNPWLLLAWTLTVGLQVAAVHLPPLARLLHTVPLAPTDWGLVVALALPVFVLPEALKWWRWLRSGRGVAAR